MTQRFFLFISYLAYIRRYNGGKRALLGTWQIFFSVSEKNQQLLKHTVYANFTAIQNFISLKKIMNK